MSINSMSVTTTPISSTPITPTKQRVGALRGTLPVPWLTVALLAVVMAYADGFWLTSLQGAVGAIERAQGPFASWLRDSTMMLPVFGVAVLGALALAYRRFGAQLRKPWTVVAAALLVAAAGTVVGIAEVTASSAYDYHLQSNLLQTSSATHLHPATAGHAHPGSACIGVCEEKRTTLAVHVRAVSYASGVLLVTNVVLVGWVVALRGGRLTAPTTRRRAAPAQV